ncbi:MULTISPECIES: hypothetical protein [Chitinophaga]|nr:MULTISPECIES: hypothetical protein [Chitinophaga]
MDGKDSLGYTNFSTTEAYLASIFFRYTPFLSNLLGRKFPSSN